MIMVCCDTVTGVTVLVFSIKLISLFYYLLLLHNNIICSVGQSDISILLILVTGDSGDGDDGGDGGDGVDVGDGVGGGGGCWWMLVVVPRYDFSRWRLVWC